MHACHRQTYAQNQIRRRDGVEQHAQAGAGIATRVIQAAARPEGARWTSSVEADQWGLLILGLLPGCSLPLAQPEGVPLERVVRRWPELWCCTTADRGGTRRGRVIGGRLGGRLAAVLCQGVTQLVIHLQPTRQRLLI